jgi:AbrB family looped-hinge helix DNA binding protein
MLTELRDKSQITLPKPIVDKIGLSVGDMLEITERDGGVFIIPVVMPKEQISERSKTQNERREILRGLRGSIDDLTMVEPSELDYESPRETIL